MRGDIEISVLLLLSSIRSKTYFALQSWWNADSHSCQSKASQLLSMYWWWITLWGGSVVVVSSVSVALLTIWFRKPKMTRTWKTYCWMMTLISYYSCDLTFSCTVEFQLSRITQITAPLVTQKIQLIWFYFFCRPRT